VNKLYFDDLIMMMMIMSPLY